MGLSNLLADVVRDVRFALRVLNKNRSFAITAILALALGSGVAISIYTLLYGLALRPFPVKDAENVVRVFQQIHEGTREVSGSPYMFSNPEYTYYRDHNNSFSELVAYSEQSLQIGGAETVKVPGLFVSTNYFRAMGGTTALGRSFHSQEGETSSTYPVVIISHRLWEQTFNSDPEIIGKKVTVNAVALTLIGVASRDTAGTELTPPDVWIPLMMEPELTEQKNLPKPNCSWLTLVGRLKPGVSIKQAQADMSVLATQLNTYYLDRNTTITVSRGAYLGSPEESDLVLKILIPVTLAVVFILLIVCTNVSNLFLARAAGRQKELAMRLALGATRGRVIQQLLTESILIGMISGVLGLALANGLLVLLKAGLPIFPKQLSTTPNLTIFACAILIALLSGIGSGLLPAIAATRLDLNSFLNGDSLGFGKKRSRTRLRHLLLVVQLAGCLLLLISTALLIRGFQSARNTDLGFQAKNLYLINLDLRQQRYDNILATAFYQRLKEQLEATPGIRSVSLAATPPLLVRNQTQISLERGDVYPESQPLVYYNVVSANYFDTMGISLVRGRSFSEPEATSDASVAVVSETMAHRYWPGQDPVGNYFKALDRRLQVIGVARNIRNVQLIDEKIPFFYSLARRDDHLALNPVIRVEGNSSQLSRTVVGTVKAIDPSVNVSARSMEEGLDQLLQASRLSILLTSGLGLLALILATVGVYGVTSYATSQRSREIGIRMALGGQRSNIILLFIKQGFWSIGIGVVLGLGLAALASSLLSNLLFGVNSLDPIAFVAATIFLTLVALVAMYLPIARAIRTDVIALMK